MSCRKKRNSPATPQSTNCMEYKFRESLPLTPIGKVDYRALEEETEK